MADATNRKPDVKNSDLDQISRDDPLFELSQIIGYSSSDDMSQSESASEDEIDLAEELLREMDDQDESEPEPVEAARVEEEMLRDFAPFTPEYRPFAPEDAPLTPEDVPFTLEEKPQQVTGRSAFDAEFDRAFGVTFEDSDTPQPVVNELLPNRDAMEAELFQPEFEPTPEPPPVDIPAPEPAARMSYQPARPAPVRAPEPAPQPEVDTLEDELLDLLGSLGEQVGEPISAAGHVSAEDSLAEDLQDLEALFGTSIAEADQRETATETPATAPKPFWLEDDDGSPEPEAELAEEDETELAADDDAALLDAFEDELSAGLSLSFDEMSREAAQPVNEDDGALSIEDELDLGHVYEDHVEIDEPAEPEDIAPVGVAAPSVETADLSAAEMEAMRPLDLPELPAEETRRPVASDIEHDLDVALSGFNHYDEPAVQSRAPRADEFADVEDGADDGFDAFDDGLTRDMEDDLARDLEYVSHDNSHDMEFHGDEDEFDEYDDELEPVPAGARASRGMMIAAVVGGIAIIGAIGAFLLSSGDVADNGGPVLVEADSGPTKIVPEDPGGKQVPNQDRAVYGEVDGNGETAPTQETLVTTTEEPIDLTGTGEPLPSGVTETAKVEDRLMPDADTQSDTTAAQDGAQALLPPRRVRTVIVKPDGTFVSTPAPEADTAVQAAEAPATAETQVAQPETTPADDTTALQQMASVPEQTAAPQGAQDTQTQARSLPTPAVIPSRPETPVATETVASAQPAPQPAVASSDYAVQISSQPTRELAQQTATDLSRRYANILSGRAITIQQAEIEGRGTFHRVRVAASSKEDAVALCETLKQAGGNCFVAR